MATKIFMANPNEEDLYTLISLEPEKLLDKFDKITKSKKSDAEEEISDIKVKLRLQTKQREIYEKQLAEIKQILNIPDENSYLDDILSEIRYLQKSTGNDHEKIETNHYGTAQEVMDESLKSMC